MFLVHFRGPCWASTGQIPEEPKIPVRARFFGYSEKCATRTLCRRSQSLAWLHMGPWEDLKPPGGCRAPDMLGSKMGTKMVPVRALKAPSTISREKFRGDAICDDGRSPNPLFWVETASFRADFFGNGLRSPQGALSKKGVDLNPPL